MVLSFPVQQFYLFLAKIYFYHDARKIENKHRTLESILYQNVLFLSIVSINERPDLEHGRDFFELEGL